MNRLRGAAMSLLLGAAAAVAAVPGQQAIEPTAVVQRRQKKWNLLTGYSGTPKRFCGKRIRLSVKQHQRAARKARNQRRNRVSHRG